MSDIRENTIDQPDSIEYTQQIEYNGAPKNLTIDQPDPNNQEHSNYNIEFAPTSPSNIESKLKSNQPNIKIKKYEKMVKMHE